jgi:hypothetical protein
VRQINHQREQNEQFHRHQLIPEIPKYKSTNTKPGTKYFLLLLVQE